MIFSYIILAKEDLLRKLNYFLSSFFGFIPGFFIFNTIGAGLNSYVEQTENFYMLDFILTPEIYLPILMFACLMIISLIMAAIILKFSRVKEY